MIVLQTEIQRDGQTHSSGNNQEKLLRIPLFALTSQRAYLCRAALYCTLLDINKTAVSHLGGRSV